MLLKNKNIASQLFIFIGLCLLGIGLTAVLSLSLCSAFDIKILDLQNLIKTKNPIVVPYLKTILWVQSVALFVLPPFMFALLVSKNPFNYLGIKTPVVKWHWVAGIVLLIMAIPFVALLGKLNLSMVNNSLIAASQDYKNQMDILLQDMKQHNTLPFMLVTVGLLAGLGEELLFRAGLQKLLIRMFKSPWAGIVVTAFLFSAIHMEFTAFIPRFALGILLGAAYWYSGSLWVPIFGHAAFNMVSVLGMYFSVDLEAEKAPTNDMGLLIGGLFSLMFVLIVLYALIKTSKANYATEYPLNKQSDFDNYFNA